MLQISRDEVHLWMTFVSEIEERKFHDNYRKLLTPEELEQESRYYFQEDRRRFLATRALLKTTLSRYVELAPEAWRFVSNKRGRPEIRPDLRSLPLRFNLSHTREVIICGLTLDHDLGVDVENAARKSDCVQIAKRHFVESEFEDVRGLEAERRTRRFYDYWTLKEATVKALGEGLYFSLDLFGFSPALDEIPSLSADKVTLPPDESVRIRFSSHPQYNSQTWVFWRFNAGLSHIAAVALRKNDDSPCLLRIRKVVP